jgi:hypothetical protein
MVTTAPHPDPRPDQEDQPDQQETARAPKRGDWSTWRGESVAIIVLSTLALHPDAPGGLPGGRTVLYTRSYGQAFHTEGGWETWTQDDGSEHLQVGDLHILLRRPDPPPRVVEVPFEFDDQALGTWPVAHPQSLAGCASPVSCRLRIPSLLPVRIPSLLPVSSPRQRRRAISDAGRTGSEEGGYWDSRTTDPGVIRGMPGPHNGSERAGPRPECRGSDSFRGTMIHGGRSSPDTAGTRGTGSAPP